jgi:hypothetical protein
MSDRRGTSVEVLKKEFEERKRQKTALADTEEDDVEEDPIIGRNLGQPGGFGAFGNGFRSSAGFGGESDPFGNRGDSAFNASFSDFNEASDSKKNPALSGHLSRWDTAGESVSDPDDLPGGPLAFSRGVIENLPALQGLPDEIGVPAMPSMPTNVFAGASSPAVGSDNSGAGKKKKKKKKQQDAGAFEANFNDMPLTTITEMDDDDDDNERGLLASNDDDDDNMSYRSTRSSRSRGGRFNLGLKAPKLNIGGKIGKFMPKRQGGGRSNHNGLFDDDSGGLLG